MPKGVQRTPFHRSVDAVGLRKAASGLLFSWPNGALLGGQAEELTRFEGGEAPCRL